MNFASPALLALGLPVAAVLGLSAVVLSRRRTAALKAAGIAVAGSGRQAGIWLTIAGIAVLAIATAGPAATVPVPRRSGTVIFAMDVSNSMSARDVAPTRLAAAKRAARSVIAAQPNGVDIGVVAFEEGALVTERPNDDHAQAEAAIGRLAISGGTSLAAAILTSLTAITGRPVPAGRNGIVPSIGSWPAATIVIFSDGQDEDPGADAAVAVARKAGVRIDAVGVGTAAGTTVDVDGYHLFTALSTSTLRAITQATGGTYYSASDASELDGISSAIKLRLNVSSQRLPLAGALLALALALLATGAVLTILRSGRVI
jgi:Ca-activated chloride channel homolog